LSSWVVNSRKYICLALAPSLKCRVVPARVSSANKSAAKKPARKTPTQGGPLLEARARSAFRRRLLAWYGVHRRELPWRKDRDPYRVWLAEIMLQQTRVAAVIEKYAQFLELFPTVERLAAASQPLVLAAWSGLGYYRRARALHDAARIVVRERGGRFPATAEEWRELPGIGRYTSAAIASIAFGEKLAVVDGNVERVAERLLGRRLASARVWEFAEEVLSPQRPGDFNQAMMELGATVCVPGEPKCLVCPVVSACATKGNLPRPGKTQRTTKATVFYALDCRDGKVRLTQRLKAAAVMPSMWELPEITPNGTALKVLLRLKHSITTTNYDVQVVGCDGKVGKRVAVERLEEIPLTGLARKILRAAEILG
jgi:A/G-specific adenine glycosylase